VFVFLFFVRLDKGKTDLSFLDKKRLSSGAAKQQTRTVHYAKMERTNPSIMSQKEFIAQLASHYDSMSDVGKT
jgi:hypothetical protein